MCDLCARVGVVYFHMVLTEGVLGGYADMALFLEKIKALWQQLEVPAAERTAFLAALSHSPKDYETVSKIFLSIFFLLHVERVQIFVF